MKLAGIFSLLKPIKWQAESQAARQASRCTVWLYMALLALTCFAPSSALAGRDFVVHRSYLVDPQGKLTVEDVQKMAFKPFEAQLARGYTSSVTWLRLEVAASAEPLVLRIVPTYLDDLQLYSPTGSGWRMAQLGDRFAFSQRERQEVNFTFNLPVTQTANQSHANTVHFLRLQTTSTNRLALKAFTQQESLRDDGQFQAAIGLYVGLTLALIWLALIRWSVLKDSLWGWASMLQIASLFTAVVLTGITTKYLWMDTPVVADQVVGWVSAFNIFSTMILNIKIFKTYDAPPLITLGYCLLAAVFPLQLIALSSGYTEFALMANPSILIFAAVWSFIGVWFVKFNDVVLRRLLRSVYIVANLYSAYTFLPWLGFDVPNFVLLPPILLNNLFFALVIHAALARRDQIIQKTQADNQQIAQQLQNKLTWEQVRAEENASFMAMLLHELRTPLSSIRLAGMSLKSKPSLADAAVQTRLQSIQKSVDDIDEVLERTRVVDKLEQGLQQYQLASVDLSGLLTLAIAQHTESARLQLSCPASVVVQADEGLLRMMVRNLISNALSYSPNESDVKVSMVVHVGNMLENKNNSNKPNKYAGYMQNISQNETTNAQLQQDRYFSIIVRNVVGRAGLPDPSKLFSKYYRAEAAAHHTGTGLGLYWVNALAHQMGGSLSYNTENEQSETQVVFTLSLPC